MRVLLAFFKSVKWFGTEVGRLSVFGTVNRILYRLKEPFMDNFIRPRLIEINTRRIQ